MADSYFSMVRYPRDQREVAPADFETEADGTLGVPVHMKGALPWLVRWA
jgi:hypothetical protein